MFAEKWPVERSVISSLYDTQYNWVDYGITVDFFEQEFLAFLFVIHNNVEETEQHESFSTIFRNIYNFCAQLEPMGSRQSFFIEIKIKRFL